MIIKIRPKSADLIKFIKARHSIYVRRAAGQPKPWTDDPILLDHRFCNMYRELDKTTIWIAENWRTPHASDPDLWFAMVVARLLNRPTTLAAVGYPESWSAAKFVRAVSGCSPAFSGAYMISTHGRPAPEGKVAFLAKEVLTPLWNNRAYIRPRHGDTLASFHARLTEQYGIASFLSGQVIADVKYAQGSELLLATDWWGWAASGPGSRRGLNRVCGRSVKAHWKESAWKESLVQLSLAIDPLIKKLGYARLHCQDLQNCLCEFDKYSRVRLGQGRTKSRYNGRE